MQNFTLYQTTNEQSTSRDLFQYIQGKSKALM